MSGAGPMEPRDAGVATRPMPAHLLFPPADRERGDVDLIWTCPVPGHTALWYTDRRTLIRGDMLTGTDQLRALPAPDSMRRAAVRLLLDSAGGVQDPAGTPEPGSDRQRRLWQVLTGHGYEIRPTTATTLDAHPGALVSAILRADGVLVGITINDREDPQ